MDRQSIFSSESFHFLDKIETSSPKKTLDQIMSLFNCKCGSYDDSNYPIIKAKIHPAKSSVQDIKEYLDLLVKIIQRHSGPFILYIDATESKWLKTEEREITYVGMKCIQQEYKERYTAQYIIINSFLIRILIKLIRGFSKKTIPQKIFFNEAEAQKELEKDLANLKPLLTGN